MTGPSAWAAGGVSDGVGDGAAEKRSAARSGIVSMRECGDVTTPAASGSGSYNPCLMKVGIIGLSSVGKSTLFQLVTGAPPAPPSGRPEPRVGVARVPDVRIEALANMYSPKKKTLATIEYVDVPGVAKGEGAALVDLPALRNIDALVHVVRSFESEVVPHPEGSIDPLRDAAMLDLELILADLGAVEKRIERLDANIKKANRAEDVSERTLFVKMKEALEAEKPLRDVPFSDEERRRLRNYSFLSEKPVLLAINMGEGQIRDAAVFLKSSGLESFVASRPHLALCPVSATIEAEMSELSPEDAAAFLEDLGLAEPGLHRVIRTSYALLGLISFLTAGEDECRAWTIRRGTSAQQAAGEIHSDIERGFIRAEVVAFDELVSQGSLAACRDKGTLRLEGKDYVVRDGDVINFRFNV
jgi:ribosome-binding ATPase